MPFSPSVRPCLRASLPQRRAFSLVELLVVIGLIAVLISLLIPTVGAVRRRAWQADTSAMLAKLQNGIERYYQDFSAYPGPLSNDFVGSAQTLFARTPAPSGFVSANVVQNAPAAAATVAQAPVAPTNFVSVTGTNNLVLGLLGGLYYDTGAAVPLAERVKYDPSLVGRGPASLTPANIRSFAPYVDDKDLSWRGTPKTGRPGYQELDTLNQSILPSFVDRFPDPMPVIYLRARPGAGTVAGYRNTAAQYDLSHAFAYTADNGLGTPARLKGRAGTGTSGGHGLKSIPATPATWTKGATGYNYPYDFQLYVTNPSVASTPRGKDTYLLISPGPDRVYGTEDDITSFGAVAP